MTDGPGRFVPYPARTGTFPMLDAVPADRLARCGLHQPALGDAEVLHSDARWRPCTVLTWARLDAGWAVLIRWADGTQDWREFDREYMRPAGAGRPASFGPAG
jgi:hypothetical protein